MPDDGGLLVIELFVILVAIATVVALVTRRLSIPYSVGLVLSGLAISIVAPRGAFTITPDLILAVLIPGLVFEASYKIDIAELRRTFGAVVVLAAPGVFVTAAAVAVIVSAATGLDPGLAFLLGAMVSATDPVAVISLFKRLAAPQRLATAVEAESLLNDGTGVVLFTIALAALSRPVGLVDGLVQFLLIVAVSAVIGYVAGLLAVRLMAVTDDHLIQIAISVVAAYGTYLIAARVHESGIIATVVLGLVIANPGSRYALTKRAAEALDIVWEFVAYLATALTFLLVGLAIGPELLLRAVPIVLAGYLAITVARAFVVYVVIGGAERLRPGPSRLPVGYLHVLSWAGLRGAIAVALALALPVDTPQRDLLTGAVYGIVLLTMLLQGTTAATVIRRAGVVPDDRVAKTLDWPFDGSAD